MQQLRGWIWVSVYQAPSWAEQLVLTGRHAMEAPAAAAPAAAAPAATAPAAAPAAAAPAAAAPAADDDETICQVCFEGWSEPGNQMLYCDRCDIAVHQGCYGIAVSARARPLRVPSDSAAC